jgi:hypothetical protein
MKKETMIRIALLAGLSANACDKSKPAPKAEQHKPGGGHDHKSGDGHEHKEGDGHADDAKK